MANHTETDKNRTSKVPPDDEHFGRTYNSGEHDGKKGEESEDISAVDQQEGNMHPGETGGSGFDTKATEKFKEA